MKLLLTSAGVNNASIHEALLGLLGKPIAEATALCIPAGMYGHPWAKPTGAWEFIAGKSRQPMTELGWKSMGVLELTALPSIDRNHWVPWVEQADVLLAGGGDALFMAHWMRESGLAALLPSLGDKVWVGFSGGSMAMTPCIGDDFIGWKPPSGADEALGVVGFSIFPHVDHPDLSENTMAAAERWAATLPNPAYAIDDDSAIRVVDGAVDVITEGHWKLLSPTVSTDGLPVLELAAPGPLRDSGVAAILDGTKTAMTGLPALHESLPTVGDRFCVVNSNGDPAAVIEMTRVTTEPIGSVTAAYAHAEGRGYPDTTAWRTAHEEFFCSDIVTGFLGYTPDLTDDTPVLTQRFVLVGRA
ncbi:Type 1 glutamine amidotransferase-like domain-containing protein [Actinoplanes friuliensis]|uniref:Peptidase S51 dipeptidase E n=1 Tax=Actinoplanes friuliensis DSM 7358 TaxID=1246995 RepID=U5VYJ4_9ACTN|nr:peptidase S51 dipeptidase E [Actinoplanes friuliensis DSM 7358]